MAHDQPKLDVLIVEDNENDAFLMVLELEATGRVIDHRRVDTEVGLVAALKDGPWDVVLSDFSLPSLDAFKVLDLVKDRCPHLPLIVVSGVVGEETAVDLVKKGASDFVLKDRMTRLPAVVERQLAETELRREREKGANALAEAESLSELLFASVSEVAIIIARSDGEIVRWSRGAESVFGHSANEAIGRNIDIIFTEEDRAVGQSQLEFTLAARNGKAEDVRWHVRKDGERIFCDGVVTPLIRKTGGPIGFAKVARDTTEKKRLQDEREEMLREAVRTSRLKDEFLSTLSHELRTPLNAIVGNAELLSYEEPGGEHFHRALDALRRNAHAQTQLIEDLLDISRIITGKMAFERVPVDLADIIDAAIESVKLSADAKGVEIKREIAPDVPTVLGDSTRLLQALWNLLANSIKFTPKHGAATVRLKKCGGRVEVEVEDTGRGIAKDFLPHVFERFRQEEAALNRRFGGLGLGLAIVRHVAEAHGGTVQVESAGLDKGSRFVISLPILEALPQAQDTAQSKDSESLAIPGVEMSPGGAERRLDGTKILVIDDHADALELAVRILTRAGATVRTANSGDQAVNLLQGFHPDLIVCDIGMPHEDGYQVIQRIRKTFDALQGTPAIALTAFARPEDAKRAIDAGFGLHLPKPVESARFIQGVMALLDAVQAPGVKG